jgi:hypothetical protein
VRELDVEGRLREGWEESHRAEQELFGKVGTAFRLAPPENLLAGSGKYGRLQFFGSGTPELSGGELRVTGIADKPAEFHAPDHRNERIRFEYQAAAGAPAFNFRFQAGFRDITAFLPADRPGEWRTVEVVALEHAYRITLDGVLNVGSSMANGIESVTDMLRFRVNAGGMALRGVTVEQILNVPPQGPWTILFRDGKDSPEFPVSAGWRINGNDLVGEGMLRTRDSYRDFEAELLQETAPRGAKVRFGLGARTLVESDPVPWERGYGYVIRCRGGFLELEEDWGWKRVTVPAGASGPFTLETSGGPFTFFAVRIRPLP